LANVQVSASQVARSEVSFSCGVLVAQSSCDDTILWTRHTTEVLSYRDTMIYRLTQLTGGPALYMQEVQELQKCRSAEMQQVQ
jgi:hypothetical protein